MEENYIICPKCRSKMFYNNWFQAYICECCTNIERLKQEDTKDE
jgi:exosome complex RNA-binding protein Csl4